MGKGSFTSRAEPEAAGAQTYTDNNNQREVCNDLPQLPAKRKDKYEIIIGRRQSREGEREKERETDHRAKLNFTYSTYSIGNDSPLGEQREVTTAP